MIDRLIEKIDELKNPSVVGLDTVLEFLPSAKDITSIEQAASEIAKFNIAIIDKIYDIVPAVKVQIACYEMYGIHGLMAFDATIKHAKSRGMVVISDVKRGDIGSTAGYYSKAFLSGNVFGGKRIVPFDSDFITVNGYLGVDGIKPFLDDAKAFDKAMFVLCKTSNPSSGQLQDKAIGSQPVYELMGGLIEEWGADNIGKYGYSRVGAVVGATYPKESERLRALMPHTFFLVPGYGAQGGSAADLRFCFDKQGRGAIVNSSRGIICAYKADKYKGMDAASAARAAAVDMRDDIVAVL